MPDATSLPRRRSMNDALARLAVIPAAARERAIAAVVAIHANELAHEARRVVRSLGVPPTDRSTALDLIATAQRALLHDVATGRRGIDPRTWAPAVRDESLRAVREAAAQGVITVAPHRQRLALRRAELLAVRQAPSGPSTSPAPVTLVLPAVPARAVAPTEKAAQAPRARRIGHGSRARVARPANVRHARQLTGSAHARPMTRRSLRWAAAGLLSTVTIVVGAAVAPAEERPADIGGVTSNVSFVDRLTLPVLGLWDKLFPNGGDEVPAVDPPSEEAPVATPSPTVPSEPPGTTGPDPVVAPVPPPPASSVPAPNPGPGRDGRHHDGDRHDKGDGPGRGQERDDDEDEDDDDDRRDRGSGRDQGKDRGENRRPSGDGDRGRSGQERGDRQLTGKGAGAGS